MYLVYTVILFFLTFVTYIIATRKKSGERKKRNKGTKRNTLSLWLKVAATTTGVNSEHVVNVTKHRKKHIYLMLPNLLILAALVCREPASEKIFNGPIFIQNLLYLCIVAIICVSSFFLEIYRLMNLGRLLRWSLGLKIYIWKWVLYWTFNMALKFFAIVNLKKKHFRSLDTRGCVFDLILCLFSCNYTHHEEQQNSKERNYT